MAYHAESNEDLGFPSASTVKGSWAIHCHEHVFMNQRHRKEIRANSYISEQTVLVLFLVSCINCLRTNLKQVTSLDTSGPTNSSRLILNEEANKLVLKYFMICKRSKRNLREHLESVYCHLRSAGYLGTFRSSAECIISSRAILPRVESFDRQRCKLM